MTTTSQNRLPWILVTLLVALNVTVLAIVWLKPPPCPPPHPGGPHQPPRGGLPYELGMNDSEAERLRSLQESHFGKMDDFYHEIVALRKVAFGDFGKPGADSASAMAALDKIGAIQIAAEKERYRHFYEILSFCTPEQALKFQEILPNILQRKRQPEDGPQGPPMRQGPPPR